MADTRLTTFANVVETAMVVDQECEALLKIRDQGKKRSTQESTKKPVKSKQVIKKRTIMVTQ